MGIPSFYRWLVEKYPLAVTDVIEDPPYSTIDGVQTPLDSSKPNPNGMEFDNLYLDMNGIIHPCFHPEGQSPPESYEDVFKAIFKYIDRVFSIIRPRKLLFMAIDGVAPRAKMNQQRSRRFKSAKEAADAAAMENKPEGENSHSMDSNIITPGTEFMASLSSALQYYIHLRMNADPGWRGVKVILSDASVVGEGEHKIMSYIRLQRNRRGYDPNTRHCLYGLDADLIMLALASHEVHFSILREDVTKVYHNMGSSRRRKAFTHRHLINGNKDLSKCEIADGEALDYISGQKFQFFNVWILREYLAHEMNKPNLTVDLERLLDDFVFMCLFVGNDFLPHVPSLEISEGAIDLLMTVYRKEFVQMGGYLTDSFKVNLKCVERFMQAVGCHENAIFRRRQVQKGRYTPHANSKAKYGSTEGRQMFRPKQNSQTFWSTVDIISKSTDQPPPSSGAKELKGSLTNGMADGTIEIVDNSGSMESKGVPTKAMESKGAPTKATANGASETVDNIKLGEEGWKERFYYEKFKAKTDDERDYVRKHAVLKYIEGMCWVMHYYYEGVCSWQWFYPYHYAPFASDFYDLEHLQIHFTLGQPFKPFDQLMGVLPPASAHALPFSYRGLMLDPSSPIVDLYPRDFELDMNGKRHEWQAICKLPFIEESRLLTEIAKVEHSLTEEEKHRNSLGMDMLFVHISHPLEGRIFTFTERNKGSSKSAEVKAKCTIDPKFSGGMNGFMCISDKPVWPREIHSPGGDMEKLPNNKVLTVFYGYPDRQPHIPRPPEGVVMPRMSVGKEDAPEVSVLWHERSGVLGRVHYERPVAKSISGSCLAKLAHGLVLEYYADKRKEKLDPSVFERLIARFVPSLPTRPMRKHLEKEPKNENDVASDVSGRRKCKARLEVACKGSQGNAVPSVPGHIGLNDSSFPTHSDCPRKPEKRENSTAATTSRIEKCISVDVDDRRQEHVKSVEGRAGPISGKRKRKSRAAGKGRQDNEVPLVLGEVASNDPLCPTQSRSIGTRDPEKRESTAATTSGREMCKSGAADGKIQEHVKSAVLDNKETNGDGYVGVGKLTEKVPRKESGVAGTISGKRKRKSKAAAKRKRIAAAKGMIGNELPSLPGNGSSFRTWSNSTVTTKLEKRDYSTTPTPSVGEKCKSGSTDHKSREHVKSALLDGHSAIDVPSYPNLSNSMVVHEQNMDVDGVRDVGKPVEKVPKKESDVAGPMSDERKCIGNISAKSKRKAAAKRKRSDWVRSVLERCVVHDPSCPTLSNSIEITEPEKRDNSTSATTSAREKCELGAADDKRHECVNSVVLDGHRAIDAPTYTTLPDSMIIHEKKMDAEGGVDVGKPQEKENNSAHSIHCKIKLGNGAAGENKEKNGDLIVHNKDIASSQTDSNSNKNMDGGIECHTA